MLHKDLFSSVNSPLYAGVFPILIFPSFPPIYSLFHWPFLLFTMYLKRSYNNWEPCSIARVPAKFRVSLEEPLISTHTNKLWVSGRTPPPWPMAWASALIKLRLCPVPIGPLWKNCWDPPCSFHGTAGLNSALLKRVELPSVDDGYRNPTRTCSSFSCHNRIFYVDNNGFSNIRHSKNK